MVKTLLARPRVILVAFLVLALGSCAGPDRPDGPASMTSRTGGVDQWRPMINRAADRFDIPPGWIAAVMMRESSGRTHDSRGRPLRSRAGAIGLMQVMPATYDELRRRYRLGRDADDPQDNIMAGSAYIKEMYDRFGAPGFLAAYNAGPGRYQRVLEGRSRLPEETRAYMAALAPAILAAEREEARRHALASAPPPVPPTRESDNARQAPSVPAPTPVARVPSPPTGAATLPTSSPLNIAPRPVRARTFTPLTDAERLALLEAIPPDLDTVEVRRRYPELFQ